MNALINHALLYRYWGFSIIPVQADKKSVSCWNVYQKRLITERGIHVLFNHPLAAGIAVVCGAISGNLLVIDLDARNDLTGTLVQSFGGQLRTHYPAIFQKLVIASTRNSGYHFFFRCENPGRCTILARRPTTEGERAVNPHVKVKVLIETKANGGYTILYPTVGYKFLRGDLHSLQALSEPERDQVFALARTFNTMPELSPSHMATPAMPNRPGSPFADFNIRGNVGEVLIDAGWIFVRENAERTQYRRPGETDHDTSGNYHHERGLFTAFTSSTEFIPKKGYRPTAVYAVLECHGDFTLAAKRLIAAGFGIPYWKMRQ